MHTVTYSIANTDDDVTGLDSATSFTAGSVTVGKSTALRFFGLRFLGVAVPSGATVASAVLTVTSASTPAGAWNFGLGRGVAADNAAAWTVAAPKAVAKTNASFTVVGGDATYDVTAIVQEIISRAGWTAGNALAFAGDPTDADKSLTWVDYEASPANAAQLSITYSTSTDTTPPTITSEADLTLPAQSPLTHALTADEAVTWTKVGGDNAASFNLSGSTLTLPSQTSGTFVVVIRATDSAGNWTEQTISVSITETPTPPTGSTRLAGAASHASEVSTTSNSIWTDLVSLSFLTEAGTSYAVFWSGEFANTSNTTADYRFRLTVDGVLVDYSNNEQRQVSEYASHNGFLRVVGNGSITTVALSIQAETSGNLIAGRNGRLVALRLTDGDYYSDNIGRQVSTTTTHTNAASVSFTPPSEGDYIILSCGFGEAYATTVPIYCRLEHDGVATTENGSAPGDLTNLVPLNAVWKRTLTATPQTINWQFRTHQAGNISAMTGAKLLVLRADGFDAAHYVETSTDNVGTQTTFTEALGLSSTVNTNPHLVIGQWHTGSTTNAIIVSTRLVSSGVVISESLRRSYNAAAARPQGSGVTAVMEFPAGLANISLQRQSPAGQAVIVRQNSAIIALGLGSGDSPTTRKLTRHSYWL